MKYFKQDTQMLPSITIPTTIRRSANFMQLLSSSLTVKFSDKLFRSPINFAIPKREVTMWESAQKKRVFIKNIEKQVDVLSYGYSQKKVLLVHGWSGRSTQLFTLADKLLEKGYMVISFDGPAHGKSEGNRTMMPDFIETVTQLDEEFGPFISAVGHSFGGMVLYNTANILNFKNFVTIGAGDKISTIIDRFVFNLGLKPTIGRRLKTHYDQLWNMDINTFSSSKCAEDITCPVLIVHDSKDADVAVSCALSIRQKLTNGVLFITKGLGHTKILRHKQTMSKVVEFIQTNQ